MRIFLAECLGTMLLILLGNGAVANVLLKESKGNQGGWIVITAGWSFAVALAIYACGWISDAHINPAVTIAFAAIGKIGWSLVPSYFAGQLLGAFVGALLVYATYYPHYKEETNMHRIRMTFCTEPALYRPFWNLITEVVATSVLVFSVLAIIDEHNQVSGGIAPYMIGIVVFAIGLSLGGPTGYAINPARDLAPRFAHSLLYSFSASEWRYAWVPLVGPIVGALLGAFLYTQIVHI